MWRGFLLLKSAYVMDRWRRQCQDGAGVVCQFMERECFVNMEKNMSVIYVTQRMTKEPMLEEWAAMAETCDALQIPVKIAMIGKYTGLSDSYLSVLKALLHASVACQRKLIVEWVPAADLEDKTAVEAPDAYETAWSLLKGADGILVPGGFGDRGVQGKILAAKYAHENSVPFFGICLGMQIAVIEFARFVLKLHDANSTEFDPETTNPCVIFMPECSKTHMGGTMRLGSRRTYFQVTDCKSAKLFGNVNFVDERHRHRYEVNPDMIEKFEGAGLAFVGKDETGKHMEIIEMPTHPYFIGVQFHPEFKSRPGKPSALFLGLIAASCGKLDALLQTASHNKRCPREFLSDDVSMPSIHQNGQANKPAKRLKVEAYTKMVMACMSNILVRWGFTAFCRLDFHVSLVLNLACTVK